MEKSQRHGADADPPGASLHSGNPKVSFVEALRFWALLGFISFGGPAGQIAIMHRELVERRRWIAENRFLHALSYCMLLPGPEAQQLATYVGWLLHGAWGGIAAGVLFVLPSIFVLLALSYTYAAFGEVPAVAGVLAGFKPVVVAIVAQAVLRIGARALRQRAHFLIAGAAFVAIYFLRLPFPLIVLLAGLTGLVGPKLWQQGFGSAGEPDEVSGADDHKVPQGAARAIRIGILGTLLWLLPLLTLTSWRGWHSVPAQAYRFFTQAALVTFGGAYAVLAYVTQSAVASYGWLTHAQAVDGLALAETTPGPLIMVLQFIGFLAGWNHPDGLTPAASAVLCALVTTYATFLPSFLFIFIGAPYIEALRGNLHLQSALNGVTAAVVGVILNLALVFAAAVIWPHGLLEATDWFAVALCGAAFVALYRFETKVPWVVLAGGLVGLGRVLLFG